MVIFDYNSDCSTTGSFIGLNSSHVWGHKTSKSHNLLMSGSPLEELVNKDEKDGIEAARKSLDAAYNKEENDEDDDDEFDDEEDFDEEDFDEDEFDDEDFDDEE